MLQAVSRVQNNAVVCPLTRLILIQGTLPRSRLDTHCAGRTPRPRTSNFYCARTAARRVIAPYHQRASGLTMPGTETRRRHAWHGDVLIPWRAGQIRNEQPYGAGILISSGQSRTVKYAA